MCSAGSSAGRRHKPRKSSKPSNTLAWLSKFSSLLRLAQFLNVEKVTGSLCGQWLRSWTVAGRDPFRAGDFLRLFKFQNIVLFTREQSLTKESLIWQTLRKVQPDMRKDKWIFLLCPDDSQLTLLITDWSKWTLFVPLIFIINALLWRQAQWETLFLQIFH